MSWAHTHVCIPFLLCFLDIGRQLVVLELARLTQWIWIDAIIAPNKLVATMLGPLHVIFWYQARGWPFIVTAWGLWDMLLLHGDNPFQLHWLHFTDMRIYANANSGSYILSSSQYLRVLLAMVIIGVAWAVKRTIVTIHFGKRNFGKTTTCFLHYLLLELKIASHSSTDPRRGVQTEAREDPQFHYHHFRGCGTSRGSGSSARRGARGDENQSHKNGREKCKEKECLD
jgi:hypothetical protein